jgi:PAS domain S-box-containing protein
MPQGVSAASVTELEAEVTALQAEAARGRLILDGATDYATVTLEGTGCVTSWNESARRVLGYEDAEILGRFAQVWFLPEDRGAIVPRLEMCRAQGQDRTENERWHLRKDGTRSWASGLMMPAECGGHAQPCLRRARH